MLRELRRANEKRQQEWDKDNKLTLSFRGNELAGEVGEACNIIKKLERERLNIGGSRSTKEALARELADVVICTDLIAYHVNIDLVQAIVDTFNATSERYGLETQLELFHEDEETALRGLIEATR
jgi:NTP pyrophosphatase (non-canonical NTP hydrolase)